MDWDDIKVFLALIRLGSVRAAAQSLGLSHSTVARRVTALEKRVGARLFERSPDGYALTVAGEDMLATAETVEHDLHGLERRLLGHDQRLTGAIRLTAADFLVDRLLMPMLTEFSRRYPDIDLQVVTTYDVLDMSKREADVALRFTQKPPEHLIGRKLGTLATATYASVEYLQRHGETLVETAGWIGSNLDGRRPKWVEASDYPRLPIRASFESLLLQLRAAKDGMGLAMLPCLLGDAEPDLRRVQTSSPHSAHDLWLLSHRDMRTTARMRVFAEFIAAEVARERPHLEGRMR